MNCDELINLLESSNMICHLCEKEMFFGNRKNLSSSPSLDRINNGKIISIDTIQIICHECNSIKRNKTMKEFINYCKKIAEKYK